MNDKHNKQNECLGRSSTNAELNDGWSEQLKKRLNEELRAIQMNDAEKDRVIKRMNTKVSFWDRKMTIPIPIAAAAFIVLIGLSALSLQPERDFPQHELIEGKMVTINTGTYYEHDLRRLLK